MNKKIKVFFDTEFTGLHKYNTIISIGLVTEEYGGKSKMFYAEFVDYNQHQVDEWVMNNVISKLFLHSLLEKNSCMDFEDDCTNELRCVYGDRKYIKEQLDIFFRGFGSTTIQLWSDCLAYDFVLFNDLWGGAMQTPKNIYYIPFDICTLFEMKGIDPDISREEFASGMSDMDITINNTRLPEKHNSLFDALIIRDCYKKLNPGTGKRPGSWELRYKIGSDRLSLHCSCD